MGINDQIGKHKLFKRMQRLIQVIGGALFNQNGEIIGINSSKIAQQEVEGIGFAIPINIAKPVIESLEKME